MSINKRKSLNADCKDGYTQIANLILEALPMARINSTQMSICLFLLRRTYGWQTDRDAISLREFAAACGGSSIPYISRQVNDLLRKRIIRRLVYEPGRTPVYEFVTNVEEWEGNSIDLALLAGNEAGEVYQLSKEGLRRSRSAGMEALHNCEGVNPEGLSEPASLVLYQQAREGLSFPATVNEHPPPAGRGIEPGLKKGIKKVNKKTHFYREDEWPFRLAQLLLIKIKETLPGFKNPDLQSWAVGMDRLLRIDKRPAEEVRAVINFAQGDPFWQTNTLNVDSLRKHYDQINMLRVQQRDLPAQQNGAREKKTYAVNSDKYERFFQ